MRAAMEGLRSCLVPDENEGRARRKRGSCSCSKGSESYGQKSMCEADAPVKQTRAVRARLLSYCAPRRRGRACANARTGRMFCVLDQSSEHIMKCRGWKYVARVRQPCQLVWCVQEPRAAILDIGRRCRAFSLAKRESFFFGCFRGTELPF